MSCATAWHHVIVTSLPTPNSVVEQVLRLVFGSPSLVVATYLLVNFLWAWWSLGRSTIEAATIVFDRSHDQLARHSFKLTATLRTAGTWTGFYLFAAFVTQIWAGSEFSRGQGGGFIELIQWSALFGVVATVGCLYLTPSSAPKHGDQNWAPLLGLFGGYLLGLAWAVFAFTAKGGPEPGDWWVCPALSCTGVIGSAARMRVKTVQSWALRAPE